MDVITNMYQERLERRKRRLVVDRQLHKSCLQKIRVILEEQPNSIEGQRMEKKYSRLDRECVKKISQIRNSLSLVKRGAL